MGGLFVGGLLNEDVGEWDLCFAICQKEEMRLP